MPNITEAEVVEILADTTKRISGDIIWESRPEYASFISFQVDIDSSPGWPLFVKGGYNPEIHKLSFAIIHQGYGKRIYGLCLNIRHRNRNQTRIGSPHKHRWTELDDTYAYCPDDITAPAFAPVEVWTQFCAEAKLIHLGRLYPPSPSQKPLSF